jgi:hypothetical protein
MKAATRDSVPCCARQFGKSRLPSQSDRSPLILYGLEHGLHCAALLHGSAIFSHGAFPWWCQRVILSPLAATEPVYPRIALWF